VLLAGTSAGVHLLDEDMTIDLGGPVRSLSTNDGVWAVVDDHRLMRSTDGLRWDALATIPDISVRCVLALGEGALAGTSEAHLYRVEAGRADRIEAFEDVAGRESWFTPWGGPPDTRSLAVAADGMLYANVHVGGIPRSPDGGTTWAPTIDVGADVHQVITHGSLVLAACASGLAVSEDRGATWRLRVDGLHGPNCRYAAVAADHVLLGASTGPFSKRAALYRAKVRSGSPFERCGDGLPEWFGSNIDTHLLTAQADRVAVGTPDGDVWLSTDRGASWDVATKGLPGLSSLAFMSR
jgi:hypothetical protein